MLLEKIKLIKKEYQGKSDLTSGNAYKITIGYNKKRYTFIFNDNYKNESNKHDFIYAILSDYQCYKSVYNEDDFIKEFGYDDSVEAFRRGIEAYKSCKKTAQAIERLFTHEEIIQLENEFEEIGY